MARSIEEAMGVRCMEPKGIDQNDETRAYLLFLLDHEEACLLESCPLCEIAHGVYDLIRSRSLAPKWPALYPWDEPRTVQ
jgi:hypothetical protein